MNEIEVDPGPRPEPGPDGRRPYRPVATWFILGLLALAGLLILGEWLKRKYG